MDDVTEVVPRHRLIFDITPGGKMFDWLKLSLRERYQYTHMIQKGNVDASHEHHLRNRLKAEITNSNMNGWSPFASVEMFNNLNKQMQIDEMRMTIGTAYSINAHHGINFGYLLDLKRSAEAGGGARFFAAEEGGVQCRVGAGGCEGCGGLHVLLQSGRDEVREFRAGVHRTGR